MNWIQENKFVSGLIAVTVIGAAVIIFLLMGARAQFAETSEQYEQQTAELQRLQALKPYPEEENLKLLTEQREEHAAKVQQLRNQLATLELAREPVSPEQFQDRLRSQVSEIVALAKENGVALPEGFYLGFADYQGTPPRGEATEMLAWELKSIVSVVRTIIQSKVASIDSIQRAPLPSESGAAPRPAEGRGRQGGGRGGEAAPKLVQRYPFTIAFTAEQSRFRSILNQITNTKEQFLIPRTLKIENEQTAGPPKQLEGAEVAPPESGNLENLLAGSPTSDEAREEVKTLSFIVGTEKVKVTMTIDIVDFAGPEQSGETKATAR